MNQIPSGSSLLSKAIAGFLNYKNAEGLSSRTIERNIVLPCRFFHFHLYQYGIAQLFKHMIK